ncbi:MAG TPA: helix-turn-helix domain-containing protein, partial [Vicinamibacterales bacterium]|nr:helix-turn-helix domain-containing protein [Vicinamibacterales bacterium]
DQLLAHVWGCRYSGDTRTVDVHVCRLRRKLPALRPCLRTVKHVGYRLTIPAQTAAAGRPLREPRGGPSTGLGTTR